MRVLVLGGTLFLGRHLVEAALHNGHHVTTFTRGRTNPDLFPEIEALRGDRDGDLHALRNRTWDAVVDTSAYLPRQAAAAAAALRDALDRFCLISTASVYAAFPTAGAIEDTATHEPPPDPGATVQPETYGPLKVSCERAILEAFTDRALIVRPGVLAGPFDPTGRLAYWVAQVAEGGEVLAPGEPSHPIQLLDARDLATWLITMLERRTAGIFNASGPAELLTMGSMLEACARAAEAEVRFTWAPDAFLMSEGVSPWSDLPLWLPSDIPGPLVDSRKAQAAGLRCRPFAATVRAVLGDQTTAHQAFGGPGRPRAITRARERELLRLLRMHSGRTTGGDAGSTRRTV